MSESPFLCTRILLARHRQNPKARLALLPSARPDLLKYIRPNPCGQFCKRYLYLCRVGHIVMPFIFVSGRLGLGDTKNRGSSAGEMGDNLPVVDLGKGKQGHCVYFIIFTHTNYLVHK